ncbi:hypothetical protein N7494_009079 [Penicillium frequentans]|uniref:Uncharacterized protein n=1 Tax=Penicillium frequentans TaxID=3151616 RepID=A0AAD6CP49_9EURO|nr:hypothetical protein N7494_009079 [Penicillium glabrum]
MLECHVTTDDTTISQTLASFQMLALFAAMFLVTIPVIDSFHALMFFTSPALIPGSAHRMPVVQSAAANSIIYECQD